MLSLLKKVFSIVKKTLLVLIVFFVVIYLFIYFINRDKPQTSYDPIKKNRQQIYGVINDQKLNSTKEGKMIIAGYRTIICGIVGEGCTNNPNDGDKNYQKSVFGFVGNLITLPYANPPASGAYWAYASLQNSGFIPKSYAAEGIGFASLKPIMKLWTVFRDIAYMLLVLVLISIGFMIMFRMKLNPQTVISVENALPKIIVSLILVTFSFAIAGFLIDLMNVLIVLIIAIVSQADKANMNPLQLQNRYLVASFKDIWDGLFLNQGLKGFTTLFNIGNAFMKILPSFVNDIVRFISVAVLFPTMLQIGSNIVQNSGLTGAFNNVSILGISLGEAPKFAMGSTISVILIITLLSLLFTFGLGWIMGLLIFFSLVFLLFRVFALLFKAYLQIFILIILSPIILLFEAVPGKNVFGYWFKSLLSEILVFPAVVLFLLIGQIITTISLSSPTNTLWTPPFLVGFDSQAFSFLLGIGIIMMIPEFIKLIKQAVGLKEGLPIQFGIGTFFGGVGTGVGGISGLLGQFGSISLGAGAIFGSEATRGGLIGLLGGKKTGDQDSLLNKNLGTGSQNPPAKQP